jgi:hypothetical protein
MIIKDDIDKMEKNTYLEIIKAEGTQTLPIALFYRAFVNGILVKDGWIEEEDVRELHELTGSVLFKAWSTRRG